MVSLARSNAASLDESAVAISFEPADFESILHEDGSLDVVISNCALFYAPNKQRVLAEVTRVLKPGGRFVACDQLLKQEIPMGMSFKDGLRNVAAHPEYVAKAVKSFGSASRSKYVLVGDLKRMLSAAGFCKVSATEKRALPRRDVDSDKPKEESEQFGKNPWGSSTWWR